MSDWLLEAVKSHMAEWRSNFGMYTEQDGRRSVSVLAIVRLIYISLLNKHVFWAELTGIMMESFYLHAVCITVCVSQKKEAKRNNTTVVVWGTFWRARVKSQAGLRVFWRWKVEFVISTMFCSAHALSSQLKATAVSCPDKNHRRSRRERWRREFVLQRGEVSSPIIRFGK